MVADADGVRVPEAGRRRRPRCRARSRRWPRRRTRSPRARRSARRCSTRGDVEGAIRELQAGLKMAPDSPGLHFTHRARVPARRPARGRRARARGVHAARSARADAAQRRTVGGRTYREMIMSTRNSQLPTPRTRVARTIWVRSRQLVAASPFAQLARAARLGSWKSGVGSCCRGPRTPGLARHRGPGAAASRRHVKEGVTAVLVDVVVRDRRGQPVGI